jgi:hypothetical protein
VTRQTCRKLESCNLRMSKAFSAWGVISAARPLPSAVAGPPRPAAVQRMRGQLFLRYSRAFYQGHRNLTNRRLGGGPRSSASGRKQT